MKKLTFIILLAISHPSFSQSPSINFSISGDVGLFRFDPGSYDKKYPSEALENDADGIVRIELAIDSLCNLIGYKNLNHIGYGLDEAGLEFILAQYEKARKAKPDIKCGNGVLHHVVTVNFKLE
jgi:hypothetical protein